MKIVADGNIPFIGECLDGLGEVVVVSGRQISPQLVKDADALLVRSITKVDEKLLAGSNVRFVATATIGIDHIDTEYLSANKIGFASAPGSNANSVAEYIACALLVLEKKHGIKLSESSIGIVGVGNVGSRVEKKCRGLGMDVLLCDPPLARKTKDAKYLPLKELYDCDFLTMHTPLTKTGEDKTYHLADEAFFSKLKDGAFFINSARGGVNDNDAVKSALETGKLAGAVLDVWENEPCIDIELLELAEIATPHIAGYSFDGKVKGLMMIYEAMCEHFAIEPQKSIEQFLPEPLVPEINARKISLLEAVSKVYDITADDADLREIINHPADSRGEFFDSLRKNYHVRREFYNTIVINACLENSDKLTALGFRVWDGY